MAATTEKTFRIFSFYKTNINPQIPMYQKAVFDHFGIPVTHIIDDNCSHGDFMNRIFKTVTDTDYLIFFDIDCAPTRKEWLPALLKDLREPRTLAGGAQTANHIREGRNLYVSPAFFCISTAYLKELGYPDMNITDHADAGQNLTDEVTKQGGNLVYWWPTAMEDKEWYLHHPIHNRFGHGTTYNDMVYHAFESRFDGSKRFQKKCKKILPLTTVLRMKWNQLMKR